MNEFGRIAIVAVTCLGILGLLYLGARVAGVDIPWWVITGLWIIVGVFAIVYAIKLLMKIGSNP